MDTRGKTIVVTGATGNQGGVTARHPLGDGWRVRALVRGELAQGISIADAAQAAGVQYLVYSSVGGAESQNTFYLERGWGPIEKWQIEEHIRDLGVPATILRPAGFMEDFTDPARFLQNGSLNVPWRDDLIMQLIAIDDIGAWANERYFDSDPAALREAKPDLMDFSKWLNRTGKARLLAQLESTPT